MTEMASYIIRYLCFFVRIKSVAVSLKVVQNRVGKNVRRWKARNVARNTAEHKSKEQTFVTLLPFLNTFFLESAL